MRPRLQKTRDEMIQVAYLLREGHAAKEVSGALKLSEDKVAKLKSAAEKDKLLIEVPRVAEGPKWTYETEKRARQLLGRTSKPLVKLMRDLKIDPPFSIRVFPSLHRREDDWESRLEQFGRLCARDVADAMRAVGSVGVSWGASVESTVSGLEQLRLRRSPGSRKVVMVPVCGAPLGFDDRLSATSLGRRLSQVVNGTQRYALSLSGVPSFIPMDFSGSALDVVKRFIARIPNYSEIFGTRPTAGKRRRPSVKQQGWLRRIGMIVTSVGVDRVPFGFGSETYLKSADLTLEEVRGVASADISGVLLARPEAEKTSQGRGLLTAISDHWSGISMETLSDCARRARAQHRGGVLVLALGAKKAPVIYECLRRGLISQLIVDSDLTDALGRILASLKREGGQAGRIGPSV